MLAVTADCFRLAVMGEGIFLAGFAAAVYVEARRFKQPPLEIWLISLSYIGLALAYAFEIHAHIGERFGRRIIVGAIVYTFGIAAMVAMLRAYNHKARARRHKAKSDAAAKSLLLDFADEVKRREA